MNRDVNILADISCPSGMNDFGYERNQRSSSLCKYLRCFVAEIKTCSINLEQGFASLNVQWHSREDEIPFTSEILHFDKLSVELMVPIS